ncbi:helix-turn-helix domain-containing protein [Methylobacterium sp. NEAU K]|uniref:helix-turn-helix domain-containing protein n=1 Tax=Methylobacterium sp. NEAU K TaxID=3064946 RepID=UPI002737632A|nr:helix-turn-helix domain-containing protein [Methylobacterium sp. NEAU K]MDP4003603.1 helix-turn-helix domain-containing protein [Methylobacterium sp. NEAU K]
MKTIFSTHGSRSDRNFRLWKDVTRARFMPTEQYRAGDEVFTGMIEGADIGSLRITRSTFSSVRVESTPATIRQSETRDKLAVTIKLSGTSSCGQFGRQASVGPGEMVIMDRASPSMRLTAGMSQSLLLEIPRERFEVVLGSAQLYSALTIGADIASTTLVNTFLNELLRVRSVLTPDAAARMSEIGVDLIVASIAERLAKEVPRPLHGTVVVQRAKAYVEAHLSDPTLDPPQLAAATGVSLRRLQELFHERGQYISDWIWHRRLESAAKRLADPGCAHLPIGPIAYGCGFANQAHFSRRFKDRFGMAPSAFRQRADQADPRP